MRNVFSLQPQVDDPSAYPFAEWTQQATKYWQHFYHFDGDLFDEQVGGSDAYPLKLNIFNLAAMMHAGFLFGEVPDNSDPLVRTVVTYWGNSEQESYDKARRMAEIINMAWYENDGRELQQENAILAQVAGGCVFDVAVDSSRVEDEGWSLPIRIGTTIPYYFFPVWGANNHRRLIEAFVTYYITKVQAEGEYGVKVEDQLNDIPYQEYWTRNQYKLTANREPITWRGLEKSGETPFGMIPYTYIPHVRQGEFYGVSLFEDKDELAKEVNARWADLGDIVADNARKMPFVWNTRNPHIRRLSKTMPVADLGDEIPGMTNGPGVQFPTSTGTDTSSVTHASNLLSLARTTAYTPDVVYGLDEGSQRSALTLAVRMIPLIVHIRHERTNWTTGMNRVARQILKICAEQNIEDITPQDLARVKIHQDWAPILPRDKEAELNDIILRVNSNLLPVETALEKFGDIQDVQTAMNLIKEWMKEKAEIEAAAQPDPFGGAGNNGEQAGMNRPTTPQAQISKEE